MYLKRVENYYQLFYRQTYISMFTLTPVYTQFPKLTYL